MLINKYRRQQEKEEHRQQERARREKDHWQCPFWMHYWKEGLRMPSIDNYPECNRNSGKQFPHKEQYGDERYQQPIHVDIPQRRRTPVYDRLGKRVDPQE